MNKRPAPARAAAGSGFTLLELMIVLVIVAVLAAIAYPSYKAYALRSSRAAAQACLTQYANWMERYHTTNLSYAQDASGAANPLSSTPAALVLDCATAQKTGGRYHYTFQITAAAYTLKATPFGAQADDTQCGALTLDQAGATGTAASCWK